MGTDESDGLQVPIIEPEDAEEVPEAETNPAGETARRNAVNESQLDDRYDDPVEQERIGNAPEPIFSSDNLFEFKRVSGKFWNVIKCILNFLPDY